ncbi:oxidoreductase [Thalassotalea montiporae]
MKWTTSNMPSQVGKHFLITGANSGIGLQAAKELAIKGAEVTLAVRNLAKGEAAIKSIRQSEPNAQLQLVQLDLSDLHSVADCVTQLNQAGKTIDVLINNAGVMQFDRREESTQGFELMWATNHLGHFALTLGLLTLLEQAAEPRVVTISSLAAKFKSANIYYQDLNFEQKHDKMAAYAQSKLANVMFAVELQSRLAESHSKIISVAAHPGYTATNLQQYMGLSGVIMNALFAQKVEMGALPTLRAATDTNLKGGEYIGPMKMSNYRGYPDTNSLPTAATQQSQRKKLWQVTEQILTQAIPDLALTK